MSIKKTIFLAIGAHLMATVKNLGGGLPDLALFDKQMGQFTSPELALILPTPMVLMQFLDFGWETSAANIQKGKGIIRFSIYFENYSNSFTGSIDQDIALRFFEFTEAVHLALQALTLDYMTPLQRVGDAEDTEQDMIIMSVMDYETIIIDVATNRHRSFILSDPTVQVDYKKKTTRPPKVQADDFIL